MATSQNRPKPTSVRSFGASIQKTDPELAEKLRSLRESKRDEQDLNQASLARDIATKDKRLRPKSTASKIVEQVMTEWPFAKKTTDKTKTQVAIDLVLENLSFDELGDQAGVTLGVNVAKQALFKAGAQLYHTPKPEQDKS